MADDRLEGWVGKEVEDFYDLVDDESVREDELLLEGADALSEKSATVAELVEGSKSWRFGHVIVDEAQDLSPMQWRMISRRTNGGSITIVGDLAQRSMAKVKNWQDLVGGEFSDFDFKELSVNYRSPAEVNEVASKILYKMGLDIVQSEPIRSSGIPVLQLQTTGSAELLKVLEKQIRGLGSSRRAAVIFHDQDDSVEEFARLLELSDVAEGVDLQILSAIQAKGLEFDCVVVANADTYLEHRHGLQALYVAVTRTTNALTVCYRHTQPL